MVTRVSRLTMQDEFKNSIRQNPISDESLIRQAEIALSRVRLSVANALQISDDETGRAAFELGRRHLQNGYIAKLPLSVIKTAFSLLAEQSGLSEAAIQSVMIVKQPGIFRDKVIAHVPSKEFMDKIAVAIKSPNVTAEQSENNLSRGLFL